MSRVHRALELAVAEQRKHANIATPPKLPVKLIITTAPDVATSALESSVPEESLRVQLTFWGRLMRRVKRWLGLRAGGPVPICTGLTRKGTPCRAPAMANGYCRMHGGSRSVLQKPGGYVPESFRTSLVRE